MEKNIFRAFLIIIVVVISFKITGIIGDDADPKEVTNFEQCTAVGGRVQESYPPVCVFDDEKFVQYIGNVLEKDDLIIIESPRPNETISSPLKITGSARGVWYFEGDFPVKLLDGNGEEISTAIAFAQGEWMTEDFVPFEAELTFNVPFQQDKKGTLVLKRNNPSDLVEQNDELIVPVKFSE